LDIHFSFVLRHKWRAPQAPASLHQLSCAQHASLGMLDNEKIIASADEAFAPRNEEGAISEDYLGRVTAAIEAADAAGLRRLVSPLHEADLADLIEALDPEYARVWSS
jgi:hypothetical protein